MKFLSNSIISFLFFGVHPDKNFDIILLHLFLFCFYYADYISLYKLDFVLVMYYNHKSFLYVSYCQHSFCTMFIVIY